MSGYRRLWPWACALAVLGTYALPHEAHACGGTFCDAGPTAMPVEQTGETILFVLEEGVVEAHIQIQYDPETEAERFAWVIPVMALPEFAVGSQPLFEIMLASSAPSYGSSSWREPCDDSSPSGGGDEGCAGDSNSPGGDEGDYHFDLGADGSEPEVIDRRTVGAFEVTVLDGGTAESVAQWLSDNGYQTDDAATPILGEYLADGFMFVAVKLATDAEAADVHPIVLRIPGDEACVPIKLTRIAAQEDLRLRVFFLARSRVVPDNYAHVVLNDVRLDWIGLGANYDALVTQAVDGAGSRAWVTEYAGPSDIVEIVDLAGFAWDADAFVDLDATGALEELIGQGLRTCDGFACTYTHPLIESVVREFLLPPEGVDPDSFHDCPTCDPGVLAAATFDGAGFAEGMRSRVVEPASHAEELFAEWPFLTRMYTTLSPEEMIADPTFVANPDAEDSSRLQHMGLAASWCDGTQIFRLPDSRLVAIPDSSTWPAFPGMAAYERIEQWGPTGAPMVVEDLRVKIDQGLDAWNDQNGGVRQPPMAGECWDSDGSGIDSWGFDIVESREEGRDRGCGCRTGAPPAVIALGLVALGLLGLHRRRA